MESSRFNLGQSINDYVALMQRQGCLTSSDIAELTAHLHDATDALKLHGLSEEEAFVIACKRLGNEVVITEEYKKVNTSLATNKVWAYMFIGFGLLAAAFPLVTVGGGAFYLLIYNTFQTGKESAAIITAFHCLLTVLLWFIVARKRQISNLIERQVESNPVRAVCLSFVLMITSSYGSTAFKGEELSVILRYPVYKFSGLSEFSFYMVVLSMITCVLFLVFSIRKAENLSLKTVFEKPSIAFLLCFGLIVESFAACTRTVRLEEIAGRALLFGAVYMAAAFLIAYHNDRKAVNKYIFITTFPGFLMEVIVGINADIDRGNTYFTAYYAAGLFLGIALGRYAGIRLRNQKALANAGC